MRTGQASRTAEYMALFRAIETNRPSDRRFFADPFAAGFLTPGLRAVASASGLPLVGPLVPRAIDRRWPGPRVSAVVRTRVIDEALEEALKDGVRQLILLGAGYDSRAQRIAASRSVRTYEVDHPTTQAQKVERLREMRADRATIDFVPVDFDREDLGTALLAAGYDTSAPQLRRLGGRHQLPHRGGGRRDFRWFAASAAPGSRIAFTYVHRGLLDGSERFADSGAWVGAVQDAGEPFTFGFLPSELPGYMGERGMELLYDRSTADELGRWRARLGPVPSPAGLLSGRTRRGRRPAPRLDTRPGQTSSACSADSRSISSR